MAAPTKDLNTASGVVYKVLYSSTKKMLHAILLIVALTLAFVNAQDIISPVWTGLEGAKCLNVKDGKYDNGTPIQMLVHFDRTTAISN